MKAQIDDLLAEAGLDGLLVSGPAAHNPNMLYFTGRVHLTSAYLLKLRGQDPILLHHPMERDEAAGSGLHTRLLTEFEPDPGTVSDALEKEIETLERAFAEYQVSGRVGVYGKVELGPNYALLRALEGRRDDLELVGESGASSVLARARATKDADEVEQIRQVGQTTAAVVGNVVDFLTSHRALDGLLVNAQGELLTVGEVKRRVNLWLAMRGADNPEGCIFAIGRDAGVPHSAGRDDQPVPVGETIIFDLFPSQAGGGYHYDFTRTWCLGYASEEAQALYDDVLETYQAVSAEFRQEQPCRDYQIQACELFESAGHPTVLNTPGTTEGYVHGLGHGVGLAIHEAPAFSHRESNSDRLLPGSVFTFEPGLYYPERGMGARLEDTYWARPDGGFEPLIEFSKELVLPVAGV